MCVPPPVPASLLRSPGRIQTLEDTKRKGQPLWGRGNTQPGDICSRQPQIPAGGRAPWHRGLMVVQLLPQDVRAGGDGEMERQEGREFPPPRPKSGLPAILVTYSLYCGQIPKQETTATYVLSALHRCPPGPLVRGSDSWVPSSCRI